MGMREEMKEAAWELHRNLDRTFAETSKERFDAGFDAGYEAGTRANTRDRWVAVEDYVALLAKCEAVVTAWTDEWDCSRSSPHTGLEKAVDELSAILTTLRPQEGGENATE